MFCKQSSRLMRAVVVGAALLASTVFLVAPPAHAQHYAAMQPNSSVGVDNVGDRLALGDRIVQLCGSLADGEAAPGDAGLAASPYASTCEYLGLLAAAPSPPALPADAPTASGAAPALWLGQSYYDPPDN